MELNKLKSDKTLLLLRLLGVTCSFLSLSFLHIIRIIQRTSILYDFQYFTTLVNWMVFLWYIQYFIWKDNPNQMNVLMGRTKGAITVYITVVSIVYITLFTLENNQTGLLFITTILHVYVIPLIFIIDYFLSTPKLYKWRTSIEWLVFPILYLAYAMLLGADSGNYVYFFLDLNHPSVGRSTFAYWVTLMILLFWLVGIVFIAYNRFIIHNVNDIKTTSQI